MKSVLEKKCRLFFLPLICLKSDFSEKDFLLYLKRLGYQPVRITDNMFSIIEENDSVDLTYHCGVVYACSKSEKSLLDLKRKLLGALFSECRQEPEVVIVLSDRKQLEIFPGGGFFSSLVKKAENVFPYILLLFSFIIPVVFLLYNWAPLILVSVLTSVFLLVLLVFAPLLYMKSNCLEIPKDARSITLIRIRSNSVSNEDLTLFALVKHVALKKIEELDVEKIQALLEDIGIKYKRVDMEKVDISELFDKVKRKFGKNVSFCLLPSPDRNAFTLGIFPRLSKIYVTVGLLLDLNEQELEAVLSHELAHLIGYDSLKIFTFLSMEYILRAYILSTLYVPLPMLVSYFCLYIYTVSRLLWKIELNADREVANRVGAEGLIRAIVKLMYPELAKSESFVQRFKQVFIPTSHPPPQTRIRFMFEALDPGSTHK